MFHIVHFLHHRIGCMQVVDGRVGGGLILAALLGLSFCFFHDTLLLETLLIGFSLLLFPLFLTFIKIEKLASPKALPSCEYLVAQTSARLLT